MKKLFLLVLVGFFASANMANASIAEEYYERDGYTKWKISNVWKGSPKKEYHVGGMPGGTSLIKEGTWGTFYKSNDGTHGGYTAKLDNGWKVDLHFDMWGKDSDNWDEFSGKARCFENSDCDISGWKYLTQSQEHESTIFNLDNPNEVYKLKGLWGQVGHDAGGVRVMPMDGHATGFWYELWKQEPVLCILDTSDCGEPEWVRHGRGDINGNKVPLPAAWIFFSFGLVGLRALGIIRKKDA